jgi:hypothetical protein
VNEIIARFTFPSPLPAHDSKGMPPIPLTTPTTRDTRDSQHPMTTASVNAEKQRELRSIMIPPSSIPCKYKALVGRSPNPRISNDYEDAGLPQHIAKIGAWNLGHRMDYGGSRLPNSVEAKILTCSACGEQGHDCSRCKRRIMGNGNDYWEVARLPMTSMRYHRKVAARQKTTALERDMLRAQEHTIGN